MLSILIPTYNFNCFDLVNSLNQQALKTNIEYEIIVMDDCTLVPVKENQHISKLPNCTFIELDKNVGRAKIRNLLAAKASYEFLLFLDCDAEIPSDLFLNKYLSYCNDNCVVCGGCIYTQENNHEKYTLRLKYGQTRESRSVKDREESMYTSFSSFNFLIPKMIFETIKFNENIVEYGHEDTVFGYELKLHNYKVLHIDNPLIHIGLEASVVFLEKTKKSMKNLSIISNQSKYKNIIFEIKVLRVYRLLETYKLKTLYINLFNMLSNRIEQNLLGKNPSMFLFDLYKLGHLSLTYKN